jgi:aryl-alcohol dehydrogenase
LDRFGVLDAGGTRLDGSTATLDGQGEKVHDRFFGQSSFATYALANERNVVKVSRDVPLERLGPLGCGIQTGAGAVMNALNVRPGTSFASFGVGAVGCSAIMAARAVGATTIVAIDLVSSRLEMAKELGATHVINAKKINPVEAIRDITGGGVDYSLEASGDPRALHQAIEALGSLGTSKRTSILGEHLLCKHEPSFQAFRPLLCVSNIFNNFGESASRSK